MPSGVAKGPVYILDLTPLYRGFPEYAQLGLDPRLSTAVDGVPLTSEGGQFPPLNNGPNVCSDGSFVTSGETCWEHQVLNGGHGNWCDVAPLRWHRVAAAGRHLKWTPAGLVIEMASEEDDSSATVIDINDGDGKLLEEVNGRNGSVFIGYNDTEWALDCNATHSDFDKALCKDLRRVTPGLRYPILGAGQRLSGGVEGTQRFAGGPGIRAGFIGASSLVVYGGYVRILPPSTIMVALELWATIRPSSIAIGRQHRHALGAEDHDESIVFWGLWSTGSGQHSPIPDVSYGNTVTTLSNCYFPGLFNFSALVPSHPLANALDLSKELESMCSYDSDHTTIDPDSWGRLPTGVASGSSVFQASYGSVVFPNASPQVIIDTAVAGWKAVVDHSAFGSSAWGFSAALVTSQGMAQWPARVVRSLYEITRERSFEQLMIQFLRCPGPLDSILSVFFCG